MEKRQKGLSVTAGIMFLLAAISNIYFCIGTCSQYRATLGQLLGSGEFSYMYTYLFGTVACIFLGVVLLIGSRGALLGSGLCAFVVYCVLMLTGSVSVLNICLILSAFVLAVSVFWIKSIPVQKLAPVYAFLPIIGLLSYLYIILMYILDPDVTFYITANLRRILTVLFECYGLVFIGGAIAGIPRSEAAAKAHKFGIIASIALAVGAFIDIVTTVYSLLVDKTPCYFYGPAFIAVLKVISFVLLLIGFIAAPLAIVFPAMKPLETPAASCPPAGQSPETK